MQNAGLFLGNALLDVGSHGEEFALSTFAGRSAEQHVEAWLESEGWMCFERNMRVPGGEVDRLFVRERGTSRFKVDLCVAEIKSTKLRKPSSPEMLFSAQRMKSLLRPNQLRVIWRAAATYESRLQTMTRAPVRTYVRYFFVVFGDRRQLLHLQRAILEQVVDLPLRVCRANDDAVILAWSPEVRIHPF